ncbi:Acetyltransferase (GNAT) domain-containing protein [Marinospirillum celere]|uniref:Acetyltransferase (GNAT) domain-containing protein n=1 Tax=Marinospirillum celere TaxID=1122252 RepID=A0A1I1H2D6_9GAMM|nr:acetyl-CoA sensor PanZ family protein [Marinospirillum celere]SFC17702.1 Acetyltransferase (GNAT) domain-containing protein [Marinospirillum celere]
MPVQIVEVNLQALEEHPDWRADLEKIYSEAESLRRSFEDQALEAPEFVEAVLEDQDSWFAGALFNDHLIGAVLVTQSQDSWYLRHLCVREVTRRRGVGSRLMALVASSARAKGLDVWVPGKQLTLADQMLVRRLGYTHHPETGDFLLESA